MEWLKVIQLRTDIGHKRLLESESDKLMDEVGGSGKKPGGKVYRGLIETDYCIHILNDSCKVEAFGSPLGVRLAAALKEFCFVRHQVWVVMKSL